jgi:Tfp pilus assembly protein PilP
VIKNTAYFFLVLFLLVPFAGCQKETATGKKPMAEKVKALEIKPAATKTDETKKVEQEEYKYDSKGRRDPFLSLVITTKQKPAKKRGASPIESFEIDEIQLLAIAWHHNKYYALVMLPDKKTYTISEGMTLGLQGGKVFKITKDTIVIREYVKDYKGEMKSRDSILKLHKGE